MKSLNLTNETMMAMIRHPALRREFKFLRVQHANWQRITSGKKGCGGCRRRRIRNTMKGPVFDRMKNWLIVLANQSPDRLKKLKGVLGVETISMHHMKDGKVAKKVL